MKTKKPIFRLVALAALSFFTGNEVVAQTNIGADCGCPLYSTRPVAAITTLGTWTALPSGAYGTELLGNQNIILTCDKTWTIDEKLYIGPGSTLTIQPGTVIKGNVAPSLAAATAIIIERGGKINAPGVEECPIVFTALDDALTGAYPIANKGKWGGILVCGKAYNNLNLALNGPFVPGAQGKMAVADGLGVLEGFASSYPQDQFGVAVGTIDATTHASGVSPTGTYTYTGTAGSAVNQVGQTDLVLTSSTAIPAHLISYIQNKVISGPGIASGTIVSSAAGNVITLSNALGASLSGGTYTVGATQSAAAATGNSAGTTLTLATANTQIAIGMVVTGTGIASNTTVTNVVGAVVTLNNASSAAMNGNTYTFSLPTAKSAGSGASGQTALTLSGTTTGTIVSGMSVSGAGIKSGTTVLSINGTAVVLSQNSTATLQGDYTFGNPTFAADVLNFTSSAKIKLTAALPFVMAGVGVSGTGIPAGTTVASVSSSVITLSADATAPVTGTITFSGAYPNPGATAFFPIVTGTTSAPAGLAASGTTYVNYAGVSISSAGQQFVNNDDSGVMTYVSIRHSGANLLVGSEINGLTLASVGSGTKIEHIEIVSCADDNIEIFGGTVNLKYCTTIFGNDDMYDYDLGWNGKAQFLFGMKADVASGISIDNDNGIEADGGDGDLTGTQSNPTIYNATILGNLKSTPTADNRSLSAMNFKDGAKGIVRNSVFAGFRNGVNFATSAVGTPWDGTNAFNNWATSTNGGNGTQSLVVKCNTFVGNTAFAVTNASSTSASGFALVATTTAVQFTDDKNLNLTQAAGETAGFRMVYAVNPATTGTGVNKTTTFNDVVPKVGEAAFLLVTTPTAGLCPQAPQDGFFSIANYRGAFAPSNTNQNWLTDWSYSQVLGTTAGIVACPTDLNSDGITNTADFLLFAPAFGTSCGN